MGYSMTRETYEKLERNRAEGRLCQGPARHCVARATWLVEQESWVHLRGLGASRQTRMVMCGRHAKEFQPGYQGVNFVVHGLRKLGRTEKVVK